MSLLYNVFRTATADKIFLINFDEDIMNIQKVVDPNLTLEIRQNVNMKLWTITTSFTDNDVYVPTLTRWDLEQWYINVREEYVVQAGDLSKRKVISDKVYQIITKYILESYDPYKNTETWEVVFWIKKEWSSIKSSGTLLDFVILKEFFTFRTRPEDRPLVNKEWMPFKISSTIETQFWPVPWLVWPNVRHSLFSWTKFYQEKWKLMQTWQYKAKLMKWWIWAIVAARRAGKTVTAIEEWITTLISQLHQWWLRPTSVAFIGINQPKLKTPLKYARTVMQPFIDAWVAEMTAKQINIVTYEQNQVWKLVKKIVWTMDFFWWKDEASWVGDSYDLIIIDECERQPQELWEDILPIVTNEWSECILISTLNKRAVKTWFYDVVVDWEQALDIEPLLLQAWEEYCSATSKQEWELIRQKWYDFLKEERMWTSARFTWDEIEHIPERKLNVIRESLKKYPVQYLTEWCSVFPEEQNKIEYEHAVQRVDNQLASSPDYLVSAYDPAELSDNAAVVTISANSWMIYVVNEMLIPKWSTSTVAPSMISNYISQQWQMYVCPRSKNMFGYDCNGIWLTIEDYLIQVWVYPNFRVMARWNQEWVIKAEHPTQKNRTMYRVPKNYMVELLIEMLDMNKLVISEDCVHLIEELKHFKKSSKDSWKSTSYTYNASNGHHDDFVSALIYALWYLLDSNWLWYKNQVLTSFYESTIKIVEKNEDNIWLNLRQRIKLLYWRKQEKSSAYLTLNKRL